MTEPLTRAEWEARRARTAKSSWLRNALQGWRDPALTIAGAGITRRDWFIGAAAIVIAALIITGMVTL